VDECEPLPTTAAPAVAAAREVLRDPRHGELVAQLEGARQPPPPLLAVPRVLRAGHLGAVPGICCSPRQV